MLKYLKELLFDLKCDDANCSTLTSIKQKTLALETAIEILENLRNEERTND